MAGMLLFSLIRPFIQWQVDIRYCTGIDIAPLTQSSHVNLVTLSSACIVVSSSCIVVNVCICHFSTDFLILSQMQHYWDASRCHALLSCVIKSWSKTLKCSVCQLTSICIKRCGRRKSVMWIWTKPDYFHCLLNLSKSCWNIVINSMSLYCLFVCVPRDDCGDMHLPSGRGPSQTGLPGDRISSIHWNRQCLPHHLP